MDSVSFDQKVIALERAVLSIQSELSKYKLHARLLEKQVDGAISQIPAKKTLGLKRKKTFVRSTIIPPKIQQQEEVSTEEDISGEEI